MNDQSPHLECTNAKTTRKNDVRNFWLHIPTKLSENVFTGQKLEGKGGARISVALIDADTGEVVKSGPESSIKLDIVVLKSDFNKDDKDNWDQEDFENFMVKEREGKGPLLTGVRLVTLKGGVGELGELIFMDNSSWDRNKQFRIGLKVASGYCGNTRIREAKTDAFRVKEHRGESNKKHHPPALHDEIWRLEKIAKDGKSHQKLNKAGIYTVGDFLQHRSTDFKKPREVLGKSMTPKNWEHLIAHAMECQDLKTHSENPNVKREDAAEFSTDHQPTDLINDVVYSATDRLSAREKNHEDTIGKASSSFPSQVSERQTEIPASVQHNMAPSTCAPPVGPEAPPANAGSTAEGHNGVIALPLPVQSQNTYFGNPMKFSANELARPASHQPTYANNWSGLIPPGDNGIAIGGLPTQSHDANSQSVMPSHVIDSSRQMDSTVNEHVLPSRPTCASISDGHNDVTALPLPVQSQNTYFGNPMKFSADELARPASHQPTYANNWNGLIPPGDNGTTNGRLPTQSHNVNSQSAMPSLVIDSSRQMDCTVNDHVLPSGLTCASISCGHNGVAALPLPVQSQNTYFGNPMKFSANELARPSSHQLTYANNWNGLTSPGDNGITTGGLPTQSHDVNSQSATPSHVISSSRRMDSTVNEHVLFSRPSHASISYGHNHVTALPLKVQSQNTSFGNPMNFLANELACPASHQPIPANNWNGLISPGDNGIIIGGSSTESHDISSQDALRNQMFSPWRKMDAAVNELILPSEPPCDPQPEGDHESDHEMENLQFNVADNMTKYSGLPDVDMSFHTPPWKDGSV
ncbi:calmodulin-binding protein 60 C-like isoform X2 [Eucalyptus grandis]|uniref:calmodulin-binding protein 60 C-like isoform X2 n=1 Tax=Eucalyptus grandis TaxID=71139 RepID=UPI00192E9658|nr:calmodulin-binding protein 60 C-like isoform X2 [Eucalyptus grandis]